MMVLQLEPNIIAHGAQSSACEKSRRWQWQQAVALPRELVLVQLEPTINTYSALNSACEKSR
eukprot:4745131-Pyramimonas_sp.AAC.1